MIGKLMTCAGLFAAEAPHRDRTGLEMAQT
ncbi:hypothetical protein C163_03330 [Pseudomonas sp. FGI182]|nr:hypothetical protein C163_03330 [Pseudomonas sp. FGI182]